jgi:hypothetical protein
MTFMADDCIQVMAKLGWIMTEAGVIERFLGSSDESIAKASSDRPSKMTEKTQEALVVVPEVADAFVFAGVDILDKKAVTLNYACPTTMRCTASRARTISSCSPVRSSRAASSRSKRRRLSRNSSVRVSSRSASTAATVSPIAKTPS